jgi:glycosyltransferase involved in cell wall biosynthesis
MTNKRLLVIVPYIGLTPLRGFEVLLSNQISELEKYYDVDILCLSNLDGRWSDFNHKGKLILVQNSIVDLFFGFFVSVFKLLPFQSIKFVTPKFRMTTKKLIEENDYDKVLCYMSRVFPSLPYFKEPNRNLSVYVYAIDPLGISYKRLGKLSNMLMAKIYLLEGYLISKLDKKIVIETSGFALISEYDRKTYLAELGLSNISIHIIPYGVKISAGKRILNKRDKNSILVTGSGGYRPNQMALEYILKRVWPKVEASSDWCLVISGTGHSSNIIKLANSFSNVKMIGFVEDIHNVVSRSCVSLCLVGLDVGVQTKVLEAMACGTPVICSKESNSGIQGVHEKDLLVANNSDDVIYYMNKLLLDPIMWSNLSKNSSQFVKIQFDWDSSRKALLDFIET